MKTRPFMLRDTKIFQRLDKMHEAKNPLVLDGIGILEYWDILSPLVKIHYLKELSKTKYGLVFRGEKIEVI